MNQYIKFIAVLGCCLTGFVGQTFGQKAIYMDRTNSILQPGIINSTRLHRDTLYIAGIEGLQVNEPSTNYWRNLTPASSLDPAKPWQIAYQSAHDTQGNLWLSTMLGAFTTTNFTHSGLFRYSKTTGIWDNDIDSTIPIPEQFQALVISPRSNGDLAISNWYYRVSLRNGTSGAYAHLNPAIGVRTDQASGLLFDRFDNLYIGTNSGLGYQPTPSTWANLNNVGGQFVGYVFQMTRKPRTDTIFAATGGGLLSFGPNLSNIKLQEETNSGYPLRLPWGAKGVGFDSLGRKWIVSFDSIIVDGCDGIRMYDIGLLGAGGPLTIDKFGNKWIASGYGLIKFINLDAKINAIIPGGGPVACVGNLNQFRSATTFICDSLDTFHWDFGDGTPLVAGENTSHIYRTAGRYLVRLIVRNRVGATDTAKLNLDVRSNTPAVPNQINQTGAVDSLCNGVQGPMLITSNIPTGDSTAWFLNGQRLSNSGFHRATAPGQYILRTYYSVCNGVQSADDTLVILPRLAPQISNRGLDTMRLCKPNQTSVWIKVRKISGSFAPGGSYVVARTGVPLFTTTADSFQANTSGTYNIQFVNQGNYYCPTSNGLSVVVLADSLPRNLSLSPRGSRTICGSDSLTLIVSTGAYHYRWYRNGNIVGSGPQNTFVAKSAGNYSVRVASAAGCQQTLADSIRITQDLQPIAPTLSGSAVVCRGDSIPLTATVGPGTYQWLRNDTVINGATTASLSVSMPGRYQFSVSTGGVCNFSTISLPINVIQPALPAVPTVTGPVVFCDGDAALLRTDSLPTIRYTWYEGNNLVVGANGPRLLVRQAGSYRVAVALAPCLIDQRSLPLVVVAEDCTPQEPETWVLPNVISPNADGKNDVLAFDKVGYAVVVFDRWGQQVFKADQYENTWAAEGLSGGTFFYQLTRAGKTYRSWLQVLR